MNFCSECGAQVALRIPDGDSLPRFVCVRCGTIHYQNPKVVVGCIPEWQDRILFCKRAIEPRHGFWTLPAGFLENDETTIEGARRETLEEANARVEITGLQALFNLPHINQVYVMFRGRLLDTDFGPGAESLEVALYREEEIPWTTMAFPVIEHSLRLFLADRRARHYRIHSGDLIRLSLEPRRYELRLLGVDR